MTLRFWECGSANEKVQFLIGRRAPLFPGHHFNKVMPCTAAMISFESTVITTS